MSANPGVRAQHYCRATGTRYWSPSIADISWRHFTCNLRFCTVYSRVGKRDTWYRRGFPIQRFNRICTSEPPTLLTESLDPVSERVLFADTVGLDTIPDRSLFYRRSTDGNAIPGLTRGFFSYGVCCLSLTPVYVIR